MKTFIPTFILFFLFISANQVNAVNADSTIVNNVSCYGSNDGKAYVTVISGVGPYTYAWSNGQSTDTLLNVIAGTYTCVITDEGDMSVDNVLVTITQPAPLSISMDAGSSHCLFSDGWASATISGGVAPYTYLWSNGVTTALNQGIPGGQYLITGSDSNGCVINSSVVVTDIQGPTPQIIDSTMITCYGANNGTATAQALGGTHPYQEMGWMETNQSGTYAINLPAGWATFYVIDSAGCIGGDAVYITEPSDIITTEVNHSDVSCYNLMNGNVTIQANGGTGYYSISLYNPMQTQAGIAQGAQVSFNGLGVGPVGTSITYTVMVTDQNGCLDSTTVIITQPNAFVLNNLGVTDIQCHGMNNGSIQTSVSGGTPLYTYNWTSTNVAFSNPETPNVSNLSPGTYTLVVIDQNGCTDNDVFSISEPAPLLLDSITYISPSSSSASDGSASVFLSGGTTPYAIYWEDSPGNVISTGQTISGLSNSSYVVYVVDHNGCMALDSVQVHYNSLHGQQTEILSFSAFPNPATDALSVKLELKNSVEVKIELLDITGRSIKTISFPEVKSINYSLDISELNNGIYMLNVITDKEMLQKKISVNH